MIIALGNTYEVATNTQVTITVDVTMTGNINPVNVKVDFVIYDADTGENLAEYITDPIELTSGIKQTFSCEHTTSSDEGDRNVYVLIGYETPNGYVTVDPSTYNSLYEKAFTVTGTPTCTVDIDELYVNAYRYDSEKDPPIGEQLPRTTVSSVVIGDNVVILMAIKNKDLNNNIGVKVKFDVQTAGHGAAKSVHIADYTTDIKTIPPNSVEMFWWVKETELQENEYPTTVNQHDVVWTIYGNCGGVWSEVKSDREDDLYAIRPITAAENFTIGEPVITWPEE